MGCCSPFSAVTGVALAVPDRHVNFTNGMILGADDYTQEFAYGAARDQSIVRELFGYGTLCGLAVDVENDGANGPRVRVAPGSAAAPSGQLICVGREQCGSLNAWLAEPRIADLVRQQAALVPPGDATDLTVYLTLCYTDCAVAPVPIPGEPCRGDDDLMHPSRIADDYVLSLSLTPPVHAEAAALATLEAFVAGIVSDAAEPGDPVGLPALLARARLQMRLALGQNDAVANPALLATIRVNPALMKPLLTGIANLWVTRLRPLVAAQRCGTANVAANDCVLLATLGVPVVNPGGPWEVRSGPNPGDLLVTLDERDRPLMLSVQTAQTSAGPLLAADRDEAIEFITATGTVTIATGAVILTPAAAIDVTLADAVAATRGRQLVFRQTNANATTLTAAAGNTIDGAATLVLAAPGSVTLVSDGAGVWHVIGRSS